MNGRERRSVELADLSWQEAERALTRDTVVLMPLGAGAKEHGPHLRLDNDYRLAEALKSLVMARTSVVALPTIAYHHYPAFTEYPGSTDLAFATARDLVADIAFSLAAHGPRRFYVLNTGISTAGPLQAAADRLEAAGILLAYTDVANVAAEAEAAVAQQRRGSHADEIETSMMLFLAPDRVDMGKAVMDDHPRSGRGGFHRTAGQPGVYSPSGVWGDATLATAEKGGRIVEATVRGILSDIEDLRQRSA
jgi:creatinine amidohydrolase